MDLKTNVVALFLVMSCVVFSPTVFAYDMAEVVILEQADIEKLTETQLMDKYIDIIVELEAARAFYTTSGFKPKEYTSYKNLLRYRIRLQMEMQKRGMEVPSVGF